MLAVKAEVDRYPQPGAFVLSGSTQFLTESPAGRMVGVEVKMAATARAEDFRHLRWLRDRLGSDFIAGAVVFAGSDPVPFGDRLFALPASMLWGGVRPPL